MSILVLGAGRMGHGAAYDLVRQFPGRQPVTIADFDLKKAEAAAETVGSPRSSPCACIGRADESDAAQMMDGHDSAISCVNYWYNDRFREPRSRPAANFCDLGGNNYVVDAQLALDAEAKAAGINIIPDCGLAPGMVSVLAMHGAENFDQLDEIHIRVGGLPQRSGAAAELPACILRRRPYQ